MPAKSDAQRRFMSKAAKDAKFRKRHNIPLEVAEEYLKPRGTKLSARASKATKKTVKS